jgi:hypothetical protein
MTKLESELSSLVADVFKALEREGVLLSVAGVDKSEVPKRIKVDYTGNQQYNIMPANDADTVLPIFDVGDMYAPGLMRQTVIRPSPQETEVFARSGHYRIFYRKAQNNE